MNIAIKDTTMPGILRVRPEDGRKTASVSAHPRAVFSEDLDAASAKADGVFVLIRKSTGREVPASVRYEASARRLVLVPENDLARGERYTARIATGATDLAGNPLAAKSWTFTVRR